MAERTLDLFEWASNNEYTGAACWLIWNSKASAFDSQQALVDVADFLALCHLNWSIQKIGKCRKPRVVRDCNIYLAREIMGFPPGKIVDHWDRDSLNDRRGNLRVCTVADNNLNRTQIAKAKSRYKGVAWNPSTGNWQVYCGRRGNKVMVGRFESELEAARAYNEFAKSNYGAMAYLNPV